MTTNFLESFNAWLKNERHHSICTFLIEDMTKLRVMLVKHKSESNQWKGTTIRSKIEEKRKNNIVKCEAYHVSPFRETFFVVFVDETIYNVDI